MGTVIQTDDTSRFSIRSEMRRGANCRQPTSVGSPINHETLGHNCTITCHDQEIRSSKGTRNLLKFTLGAAVPAHLFLSTKMTSPWPETRALIGCPPWSRNCHSSMSSVASRKYVSSLLSRSGTPHVKLCIPSRSK